LWKHVPKIRVFNRYGPTEATIAVTHSQLSPTEVGAGTVSMGRPHPYVSFFLVDDGSVVSEADHIGELYIGGVQLMEGYWGDRDLTEQVLRDDVVPDELVYRTGDLVYRNSTGEYVYVDRADRVVKRNGVRISLVELDEMIRRLSGVVAVACVLFDDEGAPGIAAFVVTERDVAVSELVSGLRELVPESMLPNRFDFVGALPLTGSNKLDERQLLETANLRARHASDTSA
jgi:D-alanine--poly(phosphoribitol) ligase subunit 1